MNTELHSAFQWDCDSCGRENFSRGIEAEVDIPEGEIVDAYLVACTQLADTDEIQPMDTFEAEVLTQKIVLAPGIVTCSHCGSKFTSEIA